MESRKRRQMTKEGKKQEPVEVSMEDDSIMDILSPAEKLPAEMLEKIMTGLSTSELFKCRLICRMWDSVAVSCLRKRKLNISFRPKARYEWTKYSNGSYVRSSSSRRFLTLKGLNKLLDKSTRPSKSFPVAQISFETSDLSYTSDVKRFLCHHGHDLTGLKLQLKGKLLVDPTSKEKKTKQEKSLYLWELLETEVPNLNHLDLSLSSDWEDATQAELKQLILPHLKSLCINLYEYHQGFDLILKNILEAAVNLEEFNIYNTWSGELAFDPTYIDTFVNTNKFHVLSKYVTEAHVYQKNSNSDKMMTKLPGVFWICCSGGNYPNYAVVADRDAGGDVIVSRSKRIGHGLIPGKLHIGHTAAYIPLNGREIASSNCEILVAKPGILRWIPSSYGQLVENSVIGGVTEKGETLYIGRAPKNQYGRVLTLVPGKIEPSKRMMFFPWGGIEHKNHEYSILVAAKEGEKSNATLLLPVSE